MAQTTPDRTETLLALILLTLNESRPMRHKAFLLSAAGFTNVEIADLLGTSAPTVAQALYEVRRDGRRAKKTKKNS